MGWDGTLWAIDAGGAPYLYNPTADAWLAHGDGIDAAASYSGTSYFFRGSQVLQIDGSGAATLTTIAEAFPKVPDSFKLGVSGAAFWNTALLLFQGGRWVLVTGTVAPFAPQKLTDIDNWPKTTVWQDGLITAVYADDDKIWLFNGAEYVEVVGWGFPGGPGAIASGKASDLFNWGRVLPAAWLSPGFDAGITTPTGFILFNGAAVAQFDQSATNPITPMYVSKAYPAWPATWNPMLNQAPSGRMGNLWCATKSQAIVQHDGENWNTIAGKSASVAVGQDNSVFVVSGDNQTIDTWGASTGWVATAKASVPLSQVAVGDADHVFALGNDSSMHRLVRSSEAYAFHPVDLGAGVPNPTHLAANADGTLWHCNSSNANTFRFISDATVASATIPVQQGGVTSVQKVASTGFGAAHCLVTQNGRPHVYRYDSPYVFKTPRAYSISNYGQIAEGLGMLYLLTQEASTFYVVAIDAHTGAEVARTAGITGKRYGGAVFDPLNELVYVGTTPTDPSDYGTQCELLALDARTLQQAWSFSSNLVKGIDAAPALDGTQLCFGTRNPSIFMLTTNARQAATDVWSWVPDINVICADCTYNYRAATPLLANGRVYAVFWFLVVYPDQSIVQINAYSLDPAVGPGTNESDLQTFQLAQNSREDSGNLFLDEVVYPPVLGRAVFDVGAYDPTLFVNGGKTVYAVDVANQFPIQAFTLPSGQISSGFTYDDGTRAGTGLSTQNSLREASRLWFGDNRGNLWSLNSSLHPVDDTPFTLKPQTTIFTTPVLYKDPKGGMTVLFGVYDPTAALPPSLYAYDPENHNHAAVQTGVTGVNVLSASATNGVVYAGGVLDANNTNQIPQVFGIRVDELQQALRDFIIESQLMQDPDPTAQGGSTDPNNPIPPSVARYQTHLTVVDDQKSPQPHEPVKIWADKPNTRITVDGKPFTIGPGDAEFASVTTGVDGSLVIVSNAADLFASPLRVWAGFMDPYERIVVNPDQEFHARVTTAHANAGDDDPDKVNLQTAHNYNGASLFTDQEKSQGQPQNCADAVAQMNKGVGLSGGASRATFAKVMQAVTGGGSTAGVGDEAQPDKYLAYADLTGASHFPTNIPAARPIAIVQPVGAAYWYSDPRNPGQPSSSPAFVALSAADACGAIDALTGRPWQPEQELPSPAGEPRRVGSIFTDFWNWLKGVAAEITHIIVAVAEDVMVGIRLIVNGVEQVFKAVIKVIEDIAAAIGSFFQMLKKLIEDVIAALSVLFQFGEIMKTHRWMATEIMRLVNGDPNDRTNYPGFATTIQNVVIPAVNQGFAQGEAAIAGFLNSLEGQLQPGSHISDLQGQGSTPHTAYTVGAQGGQKSSKAVQCSWGTQKLKSGLLSTAPAGGPSALRAPGGADGPTDDLLAFLTNFLTANNNYTLSSAFSGNFNQSAAGNFFSQALTGLLEAVKTLLTDALKVANDFIDGMLKNIVAVIDLLFNETTGFITAPIDFPIISWLYKTLFGEPLTILNLCTLVAAIPATMIYKVSTGRYPSRDLPGASAIDPSNAQAVSDAGAGAKQPQPADLSTFQIIQVVQGFFGAVIAMALGIVRAIVDWLGPVIAAAPWLLRLQVALGILYTVSFFPLISDPDPTKTPWWSWTSWAIAMTIALTGLVSLLPLKGSVGRVMTFVRMGLGIVWLGFVTAGFILGNPNRVSPTNGVAFGRNVALTLAPIVNPLKFAEGDGQVIVCVVDVAVGVVVLALNITLSSLILGG
ncbi:MAG: hypothetical protein AB7G68_07895 [Nitrospiraceae bacterium]